jgi:hypothetical protein
MKLTLHHLHNRSTHEADSLLEERILELGDRLQIDEARVRLEWIRELSPLPIELPFLLLHQAQTSRPSVATIRFAPRSARPWPTSKANSNIGRASPCSAFKAKGNFQRLGAALVGRGRFTQRFEIQTHEREITTIL